MNIARILSKKTTNNLHTKFNLTKFNKKIHTKIRKFHHCSPFFVNCIPNYVILQAFLELNKTKNHNYKNQPFCNYRKYWLTNHLKSHYTEPKEPTKAKTNVNYYQLFTNSIQQAVRFESNNIARKRQSRLLITGNAHTIANVSNHSNIFIILPSNKIITYLKVLNLERGISDLKAFDSSNS